MPAFNQIQKRIDAYFAEFNFTDSAQAWESKIAEEASAMLGEFGAWDYDIANGFFDGRGLSILIQNKKLPWERVRAWSSQLADSMPDGALLNFEVTDSIQDGIMLAGDDLYRHVVLAKEVLIEDIT